MHPAKHRRKTKTRLTGTVERIIKPRFAPAPEKAEIVLEEGEPFYREIRIDNKLRDEAGNEVALKPGAPVEVVVEADEENTTKAGQD